MQQAPRRTTGRAHGLLSRLHPLALPRRATASVLVALVGIPGLALILIGQPTGAGPRSVATGGALAGPAAEFSSGLSIAYGMIDFTSDLGTEYDPFVIGSSQPRYTSDYGSAEQNRLSPPVFGTPCVAADAAGVPGEGCGGPGAAAPADPFDPTVCQYPVRLEPLCPEALPAAPATQP